MTMVSLNAGSESILKKGRKDWLLNGEGRSSKGRSKKLPKEAEEDLIAENQRLRAEIDYLKNLQALFWKKSDASTENAGSPNTKAEISVIASA